MKYIKLMNKKVVDEDVPPKIAGTLETTIALGKKTLNVRGQKVEIIDVHKKGVALKNYPECEDCQFFQDDKCHIEPIAVKVKREHWCGEFVSW